VTVAALFDVHANLPALEAVLADGASDADAIVFGGDLVAGAWPRETLDLAQALGARAHFIRGNWERYLADEPDEPAIAWLRERVDPAEVDWPLSLELDGVLYCHATPRRDDEPVLPQVDRSPWEAFDVDEPLVVCGHTHVQFDVVRRGRRIVNPGSVGAPSVRAAAWWAVIGDEVELRATDYDTEAAAAAMAESGWEQLGFSFVGALCAPSSVEDVAAIVEGAL
jgi:predicted phosphodiesterase